jgi:DNA-binding response OmpR family regulator
MSTIKRILVVDDEPGILHFVQASLTLAGYDVVTDALRIVRTENPDIMLLDILMTPISGFDVLAQLRTFSQLPVIVFTASSIITEEAKKAGANDQIAKPFRPEDLQHKIKLVLDSVQHKPKS